MKKTKLVLSSAALLMALTACGPTSQPSGPSGTTSAPSANEKFTYNGYLSASPKTWNVHTWEENTDSYIQSFTEMGLYDCIYNVDENGKEGYKFVTEMAAEMPVPVSGLDIDDVTYEEMGYPGNIAPGMVWDIALNPNAVFENGEVINADTYVQSLERLLNPKMVNRRADSYYAGSLVIQNAERYFKQQNEIEEPAYKYIKDSTDGNPTDPNFASDGMYFLNLGAYTDYAESVFTGLDPSSANFYTVLNNRSKSSSDAVELAAQRITDAARYYCFHYVEHSEANEDWNKILEDGDPNSITDSTLLDTYIDLYAFDDLEVHVRKTKDVSPKADDESTYEIYSRDALITDLQKFVRDIGNGRGAAGKAWNYLLPLHGRYFNDYTLDWKHVGIRKMGDYKIRLFLAKAITELDLLFALTGNWIVNVPLYDQLTQNMGGIKTTRWATDNASTYLAYGPYKLTYFKTDDSFTLTKNDKWYGYTDGAHEGQFQMTDLKVRVIKTHATVKEEFKKGTLDEFTLERADMAELGNSRRIQYTPESYTTKISFNSDRTRLASRSTSEVSKTLLANKDFRTGISLIINRKDLIKFTTAGEASNYLLNSLYLTDVAKGEAYRSTTQAKGVYNAVYKELGGANGGEALAENLKGFNYEYGVSLMRKAYQEELAMSGDNYIKEGQRMEIEFRVFDDESETTKDLWNYLNNTFREAGSEIGLDLSIKLVKDEDYYNSAKRGNFDMIFSTWGGAAINPWNLMQVYLDKSFDGNCEYGFAGQQDRHYLAIDVNGDGEISADENKTYHNWYNFLNDTHVEIIKEDDMSDEEFTTLYNTRHNERLNILAGLEAGIISRFEAIPLYARNSADILSFKCDNITSTYINLIGYGGIRFMRFNYNDAEWANALASGTITYDSYKN